MIKGPTLTTTVGNPVAGNPNSIAAGAGGPVLLQLIGTLAHRNRARIPRRGARQGLSIG